MFWYIVSAVVQGIVFYWLGYTRGYKRGYSQPAESIVRLMRKLNGE